MKKTFLTFVAVAFGTCVAFAQTTPETDQTTNTEQSITIDKMSDKPAEDEEAGRRMIKVEELPAAVQKSLAGGEFKSWTIVTVTELQANGAKQNLANTQQPADAQAMPQVAAVQYEVELAPAAAEAPAAAVAGEGVAEEAQPQAATTAADQPAAVIIRYDSEGKMLSRVDRAADAGQGQK